MAILYGTQMAKLRNTVPVDLPSVADVHGRVRCFNEKIMLVGQVTADTIEVARLPKGARVLYGILNATASLGTSQIAIGISGNTGKYRAAAIFTATDTPTPFGVAANVGEPLLTEEIVFISTTVANLPASGTLRVQLFYVID
jgi:hypothetical protein